MTDSPEQAAMTEPKYRITSDGDEVQADAKAVQELTRRYPAMTEPSREALTAEDLFGTREKGSMETTTEWSVRLAKLEGASVALMEERARLYRVIEVMDDESGAWVERAVVLDLLSPPETPEPTDDRPPRQARVRRGRDANGIVQSWLEPARAALANDPPPSREGPGPLPPPNPSLLSWPDKPVGAIPQGVPSLDVERIVYELADETLRRRDEMARAGWVMDDLPSDEAVRALIAARLRSQPSGERR